jgi:peroxiredoxin
MSARRLLVPGAALALAAAVGAWAGEAAEPAPEPSGEAPAESPAEVPAAEPTAMAVPDFEEEKELPIAPEDAPAGILASTARKNVAPGKKAPNFIIRTYDDTYAKLRDYAYERKLDPMHPKRIVVLSFLHTASLRSVKELEWLQNLAAQMADEPVVFLAVFVDEDGKDALKPFMVEHKVKLPVLLDRRCVTYDRYGVDGAPLTYVIGADRKLELVYRYKPEDQKKVTTRIERLVADLKEYFIEEAKAEEAAKKAAAEKAAAERSAAERDTAEANRPERRPGRNGGRRRRPQPSTNQTTE